MGTWDWIKQLICRKCCISFWAANDSDASCPKCGRSDKKLELGEIKIGRMAS